MAFIANTDAAKNPAEYQGEATLRASERMYRELVTRLPNGVWAMDAHACTTFVNPRMAQMLGYDVEEMTGLPFLSFIEERGRELAERAIAKNQQGIAARHDLDLVRKDGTCLHASVELARLQDDAGSFVGALASVADVSERKRAETALKASNDKFLRLASNIPAYIAYVNADTLQYEFVNEAFVRSFGRPREKIVGSHIKELIGESNYQFALEYIQVVRAGRPVAYENSFDLVSGRRWIRVTYTPVTDDSGRVVSICVLSQDITDVKQAEEDRRRLDAQIQNAQKLESLGVLAGGIAHDFNNILLAILGNADLAIDELPAGAPARRCVDEIGKAARRAADLTQQMLAYSGQGRYEVREVDLSDVADELVRLVRSSAPTKVTMETRLAHGLPAVRADVAQVRQLVKNAIVNALDALDRDRGGVVTITTGAAVFSRSYLDTSRLPEKAPEGQYTYLEVADDGCGMDVETLEKLFDPFFTTKFPGRGLGMSAVLGIVRGHDGAIMVDSTPGRGTTLRVLFPVHEEPVREPVVEIDAPERAWSPTGKILFVDDEEPVRDLGIRMLERLGHVALCASDGVEAVALFRAHADEIAAVVLDLSMPNMDGEQTLRELLNIEPGLRVILSSGYPESDLEARFAGRGVAAFLQKPFQLARFGETLAGVLDRK